MAVSVVMAVSAMMAPPLKLTSLFCDPDTIQSETWLVHAKVREPHLNPPVLMNFLPLTLVLKGHARKVHTRTGGCRCGSRTFA